jgi:hypothetical protein
MTLTSSTRLGLQSRLFLYKIELKLKYLHINKLLAKLDREIVPEC